MGDGFVTGVFGFITYVFFMAGSLRYFPQRPAHMAVGASLVLYILALAPALFAGAQISFWEYSATYWFAALFFLMAFGAIYKSISLRILLDLYNAPSRTEEYDAVLQRSIRRDSFEKRLDLMRKSGFVSRKSDSLRLECKGKRLARTVQVIQNIFGISKSG